MVSVTFVIIPENILTSVRNVSLSRKLFVM